MPVSYEQVISIVANTRDATAQFRRLNQATAEFGKTYRDIERDVGRFTRAQSRIESNQRRFTESTRQATRANRALAESFSLVRVAVAALATRELINLTVSYSRVVDSVNLLSERMEVLTGSAGQFEALVRVSNDVGRRFEEVGTVASRLALSMEEIGATTSEINRVTRSVFELARISGSTSRELEAGSLQFAQGLASGRLAGDELRSVLENLPALAQAIARELGVGTQELREMGAAGDLTGRTAFEAILNQTNEITEQFSGLEFSIEQTFNVFTNSLKLLVSSFDEAVGISDAFKWLIDLTTGVLDDARFAIAPETFSELDQLERRARDISSRLAEIRRQQASGATGVSPRARRAGLDPEAAQNRRESERLRLVREFRDVNIQIREEQERLDKLAQQEAERGRRLRDQKERELEQEKAAKKLQEERAKSAREAEREAERARRERESEENRIRSRFNQQVRGALDQRQSLQQTFADSLQLAADARRLEVVTEQEANDFAVQAREDFQRRLSDIDRKAQEERSKQRQQEAEEERAQREQSLAGYATALAGFGALSAQVLGENATVTKAIRIAETIINTSAAVMRAYADIPSPANVAAAAGIAALGAAQIARIRSTDIKGRASGGLVSSSEPYRVNEMRPELFTDRSGRQFLLPTVNGRVSPLGQGTSATNVTSNVRIVNNGAPLRVDQVRQRGNDTEIVVAQAVAAARQDFANSLASGYGTYSDSLNRAGLRRRF